jgi:hypothetical protein
MTFYDFEFCVPIVRHMTHTVVMLPERLFASLPFEQFPRLRVEGEIAEIPFEGAWQPTANGERYLMVPKRVLSEAGVGLGSMVDMRFRIGNQDAVDVPDALLVALENDDDALQKWETLTSGAKRSFAYRVNCAKTLPTIAKRVEEVIGMVCRGEFYNKNGNAAKTRTDKTDD